MAKDLNEIYKYKIRSAARYTHVENAILAANPVRSKDDWNKGSYDPVKRYVKREYYFPQKRRCAYCRKRLNADAYYSQLDHVLPQSIYPRWMFRPKNLVITCEVCNPLKNADDTMAVGHRRNSFPKSKAGFTIFNPNFEKWESCFEIEDGMFIRGKNRRGVQTIESCKLHQYNYAVQFAEESGVTPKSAIKRALHRKTNFSPGDLEYVAAEKIVDYYTRLIDNE